MGHGLYTSSDLKNMTAMYCHFYNWVFFNTLHRMVLVWSDLSCLLCHKP